MSETPKPPPPPPPPLKTIFAFEPGPGQSPNPDVDSPTHLEVVLDAPVTPDAPNGANRLFIFTGAAKIDVRPTQDDNLFGGDVQIVLDLELSDLVHLIDSACYAGLAAFRHIDADNNTTFAVQGAQLIDPMPDPRPGKNGNLPVLQASIAVEGAANNTTVLSISYQANLQVLVGFDFQLLEPGGPVPIFGKALTISAGQGWSGRVIVPNPAASDLHVTFTSPAPQFAPPPLATIIPAGQTSSAIFPAPNTTVFSSPAEVDVPIVATLTEGGLTSTATVKVIAI